MNDALFIENWAKLDRFTQKALRDFARKPTERNSCYVTGYIGALGDRGLLPDVNYWLALVGQMAEGSKAQDFVLQAKVI